MSFTQPLPVKKLPLGEPHVDRHPRGADAAGSGADLDGHHAPAPGFVGASRRRIEPPPLAIERMRVEELSVAYGRRWRSTRCRCRSARGRCSR